VVSLADATRRRHAEAAVRQGYQETSPPRQWTPPRRAVRCGRPDRCGLGSEPRAVCRAGPTAKFFLIEVLSPVASAITARPGHAGCVKFGHPNRRPTTST
jgi:hypothetical protein